MKGMPADGHPITPLLTSDLLTFLKTLKDQTKLNTEPVICEYRLSRNGLPIDVSLPVYKRTAAELFPIREFSAVSHAELVAKSAAWSRVIEFLWAWQTNAMLSRWIGYLFLEFDAPSSVNVVPEPLLFLALDSPQQRGGRSTDSLQRRIPELPVLLQATEGLIGKPFYEATLDKIKECFSSVLQHGRIVSLGTLTARQKNSLRIIVLLRGRDIRQYLQKIGNFDWDNSLEMVMSEVAPLVDPSLFGNFPVSFDLDFSSMNRIGNRLGIEIMISSPDRIIRFLDCLVTRGLCCQMYYDALLDLPVDALEVAHFKLVFKNGFLTEAKSYLNYYPSRRHS